MHVPRRILFQIGFREIEQRDSRAWPIFLQMNKRAGELNQAAVKVTIGLMALWEPQFFQNLVCFKIHSAVEALKEAKVMRIESLAAAAFDQRGDF